MPTKIDMAKFAKFCKDMGFIFQSSEIYGGINGFWDYGPLGVELKKNIKEAWWQDMVRNPPPGPDGQEIRMVGLDCSIIMNPKVWVASGHVGGFSDPMVDCKSVQGPVPRRPDRRGAVSEEAEQGPRAVRGVPAHRAARVQPDVRDPRRADPVGREQGLPPARDGPGHLRQLRNVLDSTRLKLPFGIAQVGKAFRNEINPRNFTFRSPRVRADGDRVLLPPGRVDEVVRVLARPPQEVVQPARHQVRQPPAARAGQGGTGPLLHRHDRHRVPVPVLATSRRNWRASPTAGRST